MENPKISVIVPVYNADKYLHRCVDSILAQTFTDFEVLLVNDGSTDNSGDICDEYAELDSRVRVFHKENGGVSSARNLGLDNAIGEYVMFIDSDDFQEPKCVEMLLTESLKNNSHMSFGDFYIVNHTKKKIVRQLAKSKDLFIKGLLSGYIHGSVCNKLFSMEIIRKCNIRFLEDLIMWEDLYFVLVYTLRCDTIAYVNAPIYNYYRDNKQAITRQGGSLRTIKNKLYVAEKISHRLKQKKFAFAIVALKVRSKESLILNENTLNISLWKNTFTDIQLNMVVFNSELRVLSKILYVAMKMNFYFIPTFFLKIKRILK